MATYYVDPINGVNANAGTSFALRKQTLTSITPTAGDTIRIIASLDPTSMGQNGTWTDGSQTVTLTTAVTADISQATTAWTATTNATTTTSTNRKIGATSSSIAVAAAFTTGKAAYLALGSSVNFSSYKQVSFWINMTVGSMTADGDITLRLCSDTTGDVTVNTISIPRIIATSTWQAITVDTGVALGSAIQSIALYIEQDRAAQTFLINNILACKDSTANDSLTLSSLIGKNTGTEPWLPIQSISGTSVLLDFNAQYSLAATTITTYSGITEPVTAYKREPLILPSALRDTGAITSLWGTINSSGTAASHITYSGGWNKTDMSTQTGDTYISGINSKGCGLLLSAVSYNDISKINLSRYNNGVYLTSASATAVSYNTITAKDISNNSINIYIYGASTFAVPSKNIFIIDNIQGAASNGISLSQATSLNTYNIINLNSNVSNGITAAGGTTNSVTGNYSISREIFNITNINRNGNATLVTGNGINLISSFNCIFNITNMKNNIGTHISFSTSNKNIFNITSALTGNVSTGISGGGILFNASCDNIINLTGATINNAVNVTTVNGSTPKIFGGTWTASTNNIYYYDNGNATFINPVSFTGPLYTYVGEGGGILTFNNYNLVTTDQQTYIGAIGTILSNSTIRHTASGISWKISQTASVTSIFNPTSDQPISLPIAKIACNASTLVTANVWVYRTSTALVTKLVCSGGQILGVPADVSTSASGAINTWEELTLTFTPTQQGVVELQVQCYGAVASVYVDDFSVSQA